MGLRIKLGLLVLTVLLVVPQSSVRASDDAQVVSMDFNAAPLNDVLKVLSQQSGWNFVTGEEVKSKLVTVYFENTPIREALDAIISANNLQYYQNPGSTVFIIQPAKAGEVNLETRVFRLKYARLTNSPLNVGGGQAIKDLTKNDSLGGSNSNSNSSSSSSSNSSSSSSSSTTETKNQGIDTLILSLLSQNGKAVADIYTNSLIVTDEPKRLLSIAKVIAEIDRPSQQVMIEVYVMEVKKSLLGDYGVEWGGEDGKLGQFTAGSRTTGFPFTEGIFNEDGYKAEAVSGPSTLTLGSLSATDFKAVLHFITSDTSTKILARPRILTLNNEAANVRLVTNTAIANTTQLSSSENLSTTTSNQAERAEVGISLKITPQVNMDDTVGLYLEPSVTTVSPSSFFPSTFQDPTTRSIRTTVRVKDHETLVIAGLIDSDKTNSTRKVPFLGDLPGIGRAFKYEDKDGSDRELLIFITTHIEGSASRSINQSQNALSMKRMTTIFKDEAVNIELTPLQEREMENALILNQEKEILASGRKAALNPNAQTEMSRALNNMGSKK